LAPLPSAQITQSQLTGTLAYMPPEKLKGRTGDARGDLFSLGVVLYEMLSGQHPFQGVTADQILEQVLHHAPPPLITSHDEGRAELARIVRRLLEKEPEDRYQSATEVSVALNNLKRAVELGTPIVSSSEGKRTVAVLPFKLLTPNPADEYLTIGVA